MKTKNGSEVSKSDNSRIHDMSFLSGEFTVEEIAKIDLSLFGDTIGVYHPRIGIRIHNLIQGRLVIMKFNHKYFVCHEKGTNLPIEIDDVKFNFGNDQFGKDCFAFYPVERINGI